MSGTVFRSVSSDVSRTGVLWNKLTKPGREIFWGSLILTVAKYQRVATHSNAPHLDDIIDVHFDAMSRENG